MKTIVLIAALFFSVVSVASAQSDRNTWLGPYFTIGGSVNAGNVGDGSKTDFKTAWSGGANALFPISSAVAANLEVGYDSRAVNFHDQKDASRQSNYTFNYFALRPSLVLSGFMIGLGIGVPVGGTIDFQPGSGLPTSSSSLGASGMDMLLELRVGGSIPIMEGENGQIRLLIEGSYAFSSIVSTGPLPLSFTTSTNTSDNNGPLASIQLGVNYLFNLTHK